MDMSLVGFCLDPTCTEVVGTITATTTINPFYRKEKDVVRTVLCSLIENYNEEQQIL